MKINELQPNKKVINLVVTIESLKESSETPNGIICQEGVISDDTGQAKFVLWNEFANVFHVGQKIMFVVGWCKEFENRIEVSTGKFGKIVTVPKERPDEN